MSTKCHEMDAWVDAYFGHWNAHDGMAVASLFAPTGTYEDPSTDGPIRTTRIPNVVTQLCQIFPDLTFRPKTRTGSGNIRVVEWDMHGQNLGPIREGVIPTEEHIHLNGIDVFEANASGFTSVRGYFDQKTFFEQMGLMCLVQPVEQGAATFGYSMRVASGNPHPPGAIALTWITGANEGEKERIRAHARQNVEDFMEEPGFISIVTGFIGLRGFTVTAWEDEDAMRRALSKHHATAARELFGGPFVASVWTSVWNATRLNRIWVRCQHCDALEDVNDDHRQCSKCNHALPTRPAFW